MRNESFENIIIRKFVMSKLIIIIICLSLCFPLFSFGQTKIDSLEKVLNSLPEDTIRVNFLCDFSFEIYTSSPEKAEQYALEAIEIGEKLSYKKGVAEGYTALALSFYVRGNHASAYENYQKALELYRDLNEQIEVGKILNNIGASFYAQGNYQKSLEYYFNVLEVSEEKGMDILNAKVLNNIGNIYEKLDKPDQALEYYNKSYNYFSSKEGYEREEAYMLLNIGLIYYAKRDMILALKYYQQALPILMDIDDKYGISECKKNMGEIYFYQKNFEKALEYINES